MNKTLIFFHVPKTGGSTLIELLKQEFLNKKIYHISNINYKKSINNLITSNEKYDLIMGHNIVNVNKSLNYDSESFCFIREPVDHFLSAFFYIKRSPHNRYYKYIKKLSLEEFLKSNLKIQDFNNLQTRVFANCYEPDTIFSENYNFEKYGETYYKKAKKNLNNITNVYLYNKYYDAILDLKKRYNFSDNFLKIKNKNVTKKRVKVDELDNGIIQLIKEKIPFDIKLFELVNNEN